jgi:nitronate monooxygenase
MLSFGDPRPFANEIRGAGAKLICECQNMEHVADALDAGADIVVAQGAEAGGHGALRGTLTFVPEAANFLAAHAPDALLLAAGGIADGRGLAAALMLGADGVLVGTRLWASNEALVKPRHHEAIIEADGDGTLRTRVADIARQIPWPEGFTARICRNAFTNRWHGREDELERSVAVEGPRYRQGFMDGDPENTGVWFGEGGRTHRQRRAGRRHCRTHGVGGRAATRAAWRRGHPVTSDWLLVSLRGCLCGTGLPLCALADSPVACRKLKQSVTAPGPC